MFVQFAEGDEGTIDFVVRSLRGQLDNQGVELPLLRTPGDCEVNYLKIPLIRKYDLLLIF